ncbi:mucin-2 [Eurosta solidaginis]|uniref:mucin-2 n=1 Tax=Eurosta solidaginis TaxID=178769 RepID=UPI0035313487
MARFLNSLLPTLLFAASLLSGTAQARELRTNRVPALIETDNSAESEVAVVRQVYPTAYPAAGYRPGRAFNLPTEDANFAADEEFEGSGLGTTTTDFPTTTEVIEAETTTSYNWVPTEFVSDDAAKRGRAAKAPYPPASWRPNREFLLPNEVQDEQAQTTDAAPQIDNDSDDIDAFTTSTGTPLAPFTTRLPVIEDAPVTTAPQSISNRGRKAPYPPSGWRPSRAFPLPNEVQDEQAQTTDAAPQIDNESDVIDAFTTSTATPLAPLTTRLPVIEDAPVTTAPQPSSIRGRKAPYPPSGWRPSRAFLLPTEIQAANQASRISVHAPEPSVSPADKAGHPACGVSDNPMSPKPAKDAKENPDAERVYVTANLGPAVVSAPLTLPVLPRSQRLITPPIYVPVGRSFAYSGTVQSWR